MKRGETAVHHRVILLPIALWLRMDSASKGNSICSISLVEKNLLSYLISPFEVLFQWVANSNMIDSQLGWEGRLELVGEGTHTLCSGWTLYFLCQFALEEGTQCYFNLHFA